MEIGVAMENLAMSQLPNNPKHTALHNFRSVIVLFYSCFWLSGPQISLLKVLMVF